MRLQMYPKMRATLSGTVDAFDPILFTAGLINLLPGLSITPADVRAARCCSLALLILTRAPPPLW